MRSLLTPIVTGLLATGASSHPTSITKRAEATVRELFNIPDLFIENIAIRSNGIILLNTFDQGQIYSFDPSVPDAEPIPIAQIEGISAVTGIAEVSDDVFAVAGGILNAETVEFEPGSMKVALINFQDSAATSDEPLVDVIAEGDEDPILLNGITALPSHREVILGAASYSGEVWRVNTTSGERQLAFYDEELTPVPDAEFGLGINGIHVHDDYVYYTNTARGTFGRFQVDDLGNKLGDAEVIADLPTNSTSTPDDFTIDGEGNAFVVYWPGSMHRITPDGDVSVVTDDVLVNPTSVTFSRDGTKLYAVTSTGQLVEIEL